MNKKQWAAIVVALILPLLYHPALKFFYGVIIAKTPLLNIPWVQDQVVTEGLGLDAIFCAVVTVLLIPVYRWIRRSDSQLRPQPAFTQGNVLSGIVIILGAGAIVIGVNVVTQTLLASTEEGAQSVQEFAQTFASAPSMGRWFISFLSIAIFGPIVEEVLFRGVLYNGVRMIRAGWVPVVVTAVYFGLWHSSPVQVAYTMVLGLVFGTVYYATNSLAVVMILHIVNNAFSTLPPALENDSTALVLIIMKVILLPVGGWLMWRMLKQTREADEALEASGVPVPVR